MKPILRDEEGNCGECGRPFCECDWTDEDEAALEEYEERKRQRIAEANEY